MNVCVVESIGLQDHSLVNKLKNYIEVDTSLSVPAFCQELIYIKKSNKSIGGFDLDIDIDDEFEDYEDEFDFLNDLNLKKCAIIYLDSDVIGESSYQSSTLTDGNLVSSLELKVFHVNLSSGFQRDKILNRLVDELVSFFARSNPKKPFPRIPKIPNCPSIVTDDSTMPQVLNEYGMTDYPNKGDNKAIHFKNSKFKMFPFQLALDIMEQMPTTWCSGGNQFGNLAFDYWIKAMRAIHNNKTIPKDSQRWIKKREGYIARHRADKRKAGVIAMIKWAGFVDGEGKRANGSVDGSSLQMMLDVIGYHK
jgi:hypothetical protein